MEVSRDEIAPPTVTNPMKYLSLLQRSVSLRSGSDSRATLTVESIHAKSTMNPEEIKSPPSMLTDRVVRLKLSATVRKVDRVTKYNPIVPAHRSEERRVGKECRS